MITVIMGVAFALIGIPWFLALPALLLCASVEASAHMYDGPVDR